jgi:hypothetical protein
MKKVPDPGSELLRSLSVSVLSVLSVVKAASPLAGLAVAF